jgi:PTS system nitrogen regulatory IIA component
MKLGDIVCFDALVADLKAKTRDTAIAELVAALAQSGKLGKADAAKISKAVVQREREASTGIGKGVAVPHVKHADVPEVVAAVGRSAKGVDFSSLDKQPVYTVGNADRHLQAMEAIFHHLQKDDFRRFIRQAATTEAMKEVILDAERSGT